MIITILITLFLHQLIIADDWKTYYEKSKMKKTPRYNETIEYCKKLDKASPWVFYKNFGISPQGRELPLLIVDKDGNSSLEQIKKTGKAIILIEAGIHAGEIDGKDAGLMLIRDMVIYKKYAELLDNITLLFIPIFNVDGHERFGPYNRINQNGPEEMGWRVTAQNLNLNRDFLKADAPEMQAWLKLYTHWLPDFFIDCHVTNGADYQYVVTYSLELFGNMAPPATEWTKQYYLPELEKMMQDSGFPIFPYVALKEKHNPQSGIKSWICKPRLAHGYAAIQNRPGLLVETHMFKPYQQRVSGTYQILLNSLKIINQQYEELKNAVKLSDQFTTSKEFREKEFCVDYKRGNDSVLVDFLGFDNYFIKSEISGTDWVKYKKEPKSFKIPFFNKQQPVKMVSIPEYYIIPPEWTAIIERLKLHGISFDTIAEAKIFNVTTYKFENVEWEKESYEGRHPLTYQVEEITESRIYPKGSILVPTNQRTARVIAHLLEPEAPDALVRWGFFDTIFEQKEYAELYVLEDIAREMINENPELKIEFENKIVNDSTFAKNPRERLYFFYKRSPYWDDKINKYPVGKLNIIPNKNNLIQN